MKDAKNYTLLSMVVIITLILGGYGYKQALLVPDNFPTGKNFTINENESLRSISERLQKEGYITSPLLFRAGVSFFGKDRSIQIGGYSFSTPKTLLGMVLSFVNGHPTTPLLSITIPEGSTSLEVASIISRALPAASPSEFDSLIAKYHAEGKLFPSTYFLLPSYTEEDIITLMLSTFTKKVEHIIIPSKIAPPLTTVNDVLVLASILEGEAKYEEDMKLVAGILLARLSLGMPLQVDVAKETYAKKGLPERPLNNPGITAIQAVLSPIQTDYLYYITGNDGKMYYAKTFDEHKRNIKKYLK